VIAEDGDAFYHGTVSSLGAEKDAELLENVVPGWLAECLLLGRIPGTGAASAVSAAGKIGFLLVPWRRTGTKDKKEKDPSGKENKERRSSKESELWEELPELSNS
jgi:hypothetical protein